MESRAKAIIEAMPLRTGVQKKRESPAAVPRRPVRKPSFLNGVAAKLNKSP